MRRELPSFGGATGWINSPPLNAAALHGRVVLVDFWTYSCINWQRTAPYIRAWADKYRAQGLVVVGVHSPEFHFERDMENVRRAVHDSRIEYPIAIDSDHAIWRAFDNAYWPALYFADSTGRIRHHHFGEGAYEESEQMLQMLLREGARTGVPDDLVAVEGRGIEAAANWETLLSPENYLGSERTQNFASHGAGAIGVRHTYAPPSRLDLNHWALTGDWTVRGQSTESNAADGRITYRFHARDLHLVMGPAVPRTPVRFRIRVDGQLPGAAHGSDVNAAGEGQVIEQRLYQLVRQPTPITERVFEIEFMDTGVEAFAFTFG